MNKFAIIVGDRGQDGTLLKANLERKGIPVAGCSRNRLTMPLSFSGSSDTEFSITNTEQVSTLIAAVRPSEIYYLAAHHVSSEQNGIDNSPSEYDAFHQVHIVGLLNFLWAIRNHSPESRLFYAASSLVFSGIDGPIQNEETPFTPTGFYGLTKAQGVYICREFRKKHAVFATTGILYNHESALRRNQFLSKKLIAAAHGISLGMQQNVLLGSLAAEADWGYAPDYVDAFQRILAAEVPDDFVVATGESHTVAEFVDIVFKCFGLEAGRFAIEDTNMLNRHVPRKIGDSSKLRRVTGWMPTYDFPTMVQTLVKDYLENLEVKSLSKELISLQPK